MTLLLLGRKRANGGKQRPRLDTRLDREGSALAIVPIGVALVAAVAVVLEADGLAAAGSEGVVGVLVAGHRVDVGFGFLGRLDPNVAVAGDAGARRDELADDDVLLEAEQGVTPGVDGRVGEDTR